jgi:hypothetical protein
VTAIAVLSIALAACARPSGEAAAGAFNRTALARAEGPSVEARDASEVEAAAIRAAGAARLAVAAPTRTEAAATPFLYASPVGRRFLSTIGPRALARGEPPELCPAVAAAGGPTPAQAARDATLRCLTALGEAPGGRTECSCRVLAVDDVMLAEPEAFAYAPGVGGRLVGLGQGARPLTVEERATDDPDRTLIAFYDAGGPVAVGELGAGGEARLVMLETGALYEGAREPRGWRRGRLLERLLLTGRDGKRLIALVGFEPGDIAAEGPALAAWPRG